MYKKLSILVFLSALSLRSMEQDSYKFESVNTTVEQKVEHKSEQMPLEIPGMCEKGWVHAGIMRITLQRFISLYDVKKLSAVKEENGLKKLWL